MKTNISINNEEVLKRFISFTNKFYSNIDIHKGKHCVDAKSIMGVLAFGFGEDLEVEIITHNEDELVSFVRGVAEFER